MTVFIGLYHLKQPINLQKTVLLEPPQQFCVFSFIDNYGNRKNATRLCCDAKGVTTIA